MKLDINELLPADARRWVYLGYAVAILLLGCVTAGFGAAGLAVPVAVTVAGAVLANLGAGLGILAAANTPAKQAAESGARRALVEDVDDIPAEPVDDLDALS